MTEKTAAAPPAAGAGERTVGPDAIAEFERLYRANVDAVIGYFARRSRDPHVVADLTADTFVAVITAFRTFDPRKGTARAWMFGIARRVYASHCQAHSQQQAGAAGRAGVSWHRTRSRNSSTGSTPNEPAGTSSPGWPACQNGTAQ